MKKWMMLLTGILTALSLAACTPTQVDETIPQPVGGAHPAGITPEMVRESNGAEEKLPDPNAPILEMAFVYSIDASGAKLTRELVDLEKLTEEALVACLIERGVLEEGTEVNGFDIDGGAKAGPGVTAEAAGDGERIGTLDLTGFPKADAAKEKLLLQAVANTFIENYELDKIKLLIEGANYTSDNVSQGDEDYLVLEE